MERRAVILLALLLGACQASPPWPVYTIRYEPLYYIGPSGAHIPLDQPIERDYSR
jgi:hypothetical protein